MIEREVTVANRLGLHARASARLVQLLSRFQSRARLGHNGREVDAKSIMGVMMLAAAQGTRLHLRIEGEDAEQAMAAAMDLFCRKFDEDE